MNIIGLTAFHGASSAALLQNGAMVAAIQEERLTRVPWDRRIPINAFRACLELGKIANPSQVDALAFYRDPYKKRERQIRSGLDPALDISLGWLDPLRAEDEIKRFLGYDGPIYYFDYLESFAAGSVGSECAVLSLCSIGDNESVAWGAWSDHKITWSGFRPFPHSPDMFLSLVCQFLGFDPLRDEKKVFALSLTGHPRFQTQMNQIHKDVSPTHYEIDVRFGQFTQSEILYSQAFVDLMGCPPRSPQDPFEAVHRDIAASAIALYEKVLLSYLTLLSLASKNRRRLKISSSIGELILARHTNLPFAGFDFSSPADESRAAIGAAVLASRKLDPSTDIVIPTSLVLSPSPTKLSIERTMKASGLVLSHFPGDRDRQVTALVERLSAFKSLALFQGPDQIASASPGARSILVNPLNPDALANLSTQGVKLSEQFGATIFVLAAFAKNDWGIDADQLWLQADFPKAIQNSGLKHCSYLEVKIIADRHESFLHDLLVAFFQKTSCAFLLATPFAVGSEPKVAATEDALRSMVKSQLDTLAFEDYVLDKTNIPLSLRKPPTADPMERGDTRANHPLVVQRPERLRPAESMLPRGINLFQ